MLAPTETPHSEASMIVLVQESGPTKSHPPHLAEAIQALRNIYGPKNIVFDLEEKPYSPPTLVAFYVHNGQSTRLGPVR
jgi:hypothetical protein